MQEMRVSINVENNKSNRTTCHFYNKALTGLSAPAYVYDVYTV